MKLMMFSKWLGQYDVAEAGRLVAGLGFDGVDLTVRPRGHVPPENAAVALPEAVRALAGLGLATPLITTDITEAGAAHAAQIFDAAAASGVSELKLGYWRCPPGGRVQSLLDQAARKLDGIEKLAQRAGVRANIHTHSGPNLSALAPLVWWLIKDRDPRAVGAYVDPGHMVLEGGVSGWRMGLELLCGRITVAAVKDMSWESQPDAALGKARWGWVNAPLRDGIVPWPDVFACLREAGFDGWCSVHHEYWGRSPWREMDWAGRKAHALAELEYLRWSMGAGATAESAS
jgi:sugar phosphate isomerase/epimerase